jgi:hypothetical protein
VDKDRIDGLSQNDVEFEYMKQFGGFPFYSYSGDNMIEDMRDALINGEPYEQAITQNVSLN